MRALRTATLIFLSAIVAVTAAVGVIVWGLPLVPGWADEPVVAVTWPEATAERAVAEPAPPAVEITLLAVGDLMGHGPQRSAAQTADGYDFNPCFEPVRDIISGADLAIGNLETPLAGSASGYSGYPAFNNPDAFAEAAAEAGFDVLTTANNHALDRGLQGLITTRDTLERIGLATTGTARTAEEAGLVLTRDVEGVTVAILAYTYGTNGLTPPVGSRWAVNVIDRDAMTADIDRARTDGADVVIVSVHNGVEYERQPSVSQKALELAMVEAGADIVLGSHPHVIQPMQVVQAERPDGTTRDAFIIHSLGNFVSSQRDRFRDAGVIVSLTLSKNLRSGEVSLVRVEYVPTWVDSTGDSGALYRILPIARALTDPTYAHVSAVDRQRMTQAYADTVQHLGGDEAEPDPAADPVVFWSAQTGG